MQLTLGEHRIGQELKGLQLGRLVGYQHTPHTQGILTPVIESWAA